MTVANDLALLDRRVLYLEGKTREFVYALGHIKREARALQASIRSAPRTVMGGLGITELMPGTETRDVHLVNQAERQWATRIGRILRDLRSALERYQQIVAQIDRDELDRPQAIHAREQINRGNRAVQYSADYIRQWRAMNASRFDPHNRDITAPLLRIVMPDSVSFALTGRGTAETADIAAETAGEVAGEVVDVVKDVARGGAGAAGLFGRLFGAGKGLRPSDYAALGLLGLGTVAVGYVYLKVRY
jgi:hypothetical protein